MVPALIMPKLFLVTYGFYMEMPIWKPYITGTKIETFILKYSYQTCFLKFS